MSWYTPILKWAVDKNRTRCYSVIHSWVYLGLTFDGLMFRWNWCCGWKQMVQWNRVSVDACDRFVSLSYINLTAGVWHRPADNDLFRNSDASLGLNVGQGDSTNVNTQRPNNDKFVFFGPPSPNPIQARPSAMCPPAALDVSALRCHASSTHPICPWTKSISRV